MNSFETWQSTDINDSLRDIFRPNETIWSTNLTLTVRAWGLFISIFGGIGNAITAFAILHQFMLNRKRKKIIYSSKFSNPPVNDDNFQDSIRSPNDGTICSPVHSWKRNSSGTGSYHGKETISTVLSVDGDTILIFHLTLCDLIYCVISLPHTCYVIGIDSLSGFVPLLCEEMAFFRYVNAYVEWMTLGLLIMQRCVDLAKLPRARFFRLKSTVAFIIGIWIFSCILLLGYYITGCFGYNNITRKCDFMGSKEGMLHFYVLDSLIPCALMSCGCLSIIVQILKNKKRLQKLSIRSEVLMQREKEVFQSTLLILCLLLLFLISVIPICVYNVLYALGMTNNIVVGIFIFMLYWVQYGVNFIAYAAINSKYRRAYALFFIDGKRRLEWVICSSRRHGADDCACHSNQVEV